MKQCVQPRLFHIVPSQDWPMAHPAEWLGGVNEGDRRKNW